MRRSLNELAPTTIAAYRGRARKLHLKIHAGEASVADPLELAELEALLGQRNPAPRTPPEVGTPMSPPVAAPFTVYCEEYVQELIGQLDGEVIQA